MDNKKISIGLAMAAIMVAAVFTPLAFAADVGYDVNVLGGQSTYICCGPEGDFGALLPGAAPKEILGTFGLKNEGDVNATVNASFTTSKAVGEFGLVNAGTTEVILAEHFELRKNGNESEDGLYSCCTLVGSGDGDEGWVITPDSDLAYIDSNSNGTFDCGEPIYNDNDVDGFVSVGDHRKTDSVYGSCCSTVASGDTDVGQSLLTLSNAGFVDLNGDTDFDCGEPIYNDNDVDGFVSVGDHRKTDVFCAPCVCAESTCCGAGEAYTPLGNDGVDVPLPGTIPKEEACCCCYDAKLTVPSTTVPDHYAGNVQLTFSDV